MARLVKSGWNWDHMVTFQTLQTWICHVWKVVISFSNLNFSHIELVTTHYQTLQTWVGLNATRYHSLNALPHAFPHTSLYTFSEICLVLGYLQRVTTPYRHMVTCEVTHWSYGNVLYYVLSILNWEKMYGNACGNALKLW